MKDFRHLTTDPSILNGSVIVRGSRMKPMHVVDYVCNFGLKEFMYIWDYISVDAVKECFEFMGKDWTKSVEES